MGINILMPCVAGGMFMGPYSDALRGWWYVHGSILMPCVAGGMFMGSLLMPCVAGGVFMGAY